MKPSSIDVMESVPLVMERVASTIRVTNAVASKQSPKKRRNSRNMISVYSPWIACPSGQTRNWIRTSMKPEPGFIGLGSALYSCGNGMLRDDFISQAVGCCPKAFFSGQRCSDCVRAAQRIYTTLHSLLGYFLELRWGHPRTQRSFSVSSANPSWSAKGENI